MIGWFDPDWQGFRLGVCVSCGLELSLYKHAHCPVAMLNVNARAYGGAAQRKVGLEPFRKEASLTIAPI